VVERSDTTGKLPLPLLSIPEGSQTITECSSAMNESSDQLDAWKEELFLRAEQYHRTLQRVAWNYRMVGWVIVAIAILFYVIAFLVMMFAQPPAAPVAGPAPNPLNELVLAIAVTAILVVPLVFFYRLVGAHIARARRWAIVVGLLWTGFSIVGCLRMLLFVPMNQPSVVIGIVLCVLNGFLFISLLLCLRSAMILHQLFRQHRELSTPLLSPLNPNDLPHT